MQCDIYVGSSSYSLLVSAHDNLGMAPLHRLSERGPMQHGASDVGFRLDPRIFALGGLLRSEDEGDLHDLRNDLLTAIRPSATLRIVLTLLNGDVRAIDCHTIDAPLPRTYRSDTTLSEVAIRFRAADPTFYHPVARFQVFGLAGTGDGMFVATEVPTEIGGSTLDQRVNTMYRGNFHSHPHLVRIEGPITDPVITNETTNEKLDFTGTTIAGGEHYDIDCRYGYKTVIDQDGANVIADLTDDSDLATFHLRVRDARIGNASVNTFHVTGTAITPATSIRLVWYDRFLGI